MADILHQFVVQAPPAKVFEVAATPAGLAQWWTKSSSGEPREGAIYTLYFGPDYDWRGRVTRYEPDAAFELEMTEASPDWIATRVGFELEPSGNGATTVRFYHTGWPAANEHWRVSCNCWAMYLRILRRYVEHGETVPYEKRLDV